MPSDKEIATFALLLRHFQLYKPEELYKVVCPFHDDKNASMQISIPKAFFYCYGCGACGSSIELYKHFAKLEGKSLTDLQARMQISKLLRTHDKLLSSNTTVQTPFSLLGSNTSIPSSFTFQQKETYREGITEARQYFYNLPTPNWYRPSKVPAIEEEQRACLKYMKKRGFTSLMLNKSQAKPSLNKYYPIVLPLLENGIFRGYVSRTFDPDIEQERKYMYNRGFKRERTLAGNYKYSDTVLVVEGYIDCLKAQSLGFKNVVAILGWKMSGTQLEKLKKAKVKHIICGTDNDDAGRKGYKYLKLIQKQQQWFEVSRVRFPKGVKDFGDLSKGTPEANRMVEQLKKLGLK